MIYSRHQYYIVVSFYRFSWLVPEGPGPVCGIARGTEIARTPGHQYLRVARLSLTVEAPNPPQANLHALTGRDRTDKKARSRV